MHVKLSSICSRWKHLLTTILSGRCFVDGVKPCLTAARKPFRRCQNVRQKAEIARQNYAKGSRSGGQGGYLTFTLFDKGRFKLSVYPIPRTGKFKGEYMFNRFLKDQTGATSVEYGIIASVLSLAIITGVGLLATQISAMWTNNSTVISGGLH